MNATVAEEVWKGPVCESVAWQAGYREGRSGEDLPKRRKGTDANWQRCVDGYNYGRLFYALDLWCKKHHRSSVFVGDPIPKDDPFPWTRQEVEQWLANNRKLFLGHRRKAKKKRK